MITGPVPYPGVHFCSDKGTNTYGDRVAADTTQTGGHGRTDKHPTLALLLGVCQAETCSGDNLSMISDAAIAATRAQAAR